MTSYVNRVNVDDGAYEPGYRGDEFKKVSEKVLYRNEARDYNPVGDEINSYMSGESYLSSVNDIAVMENDDITKVAPYHKPLLYPTTKGDDANPVQDNKVDVSLWFIFLIIIIVVFGCMLLDISFDDSNNTNN